MPGATERFIIGTKLRELRRQRDYLQEAYRRLRASVAQSDSDVERLRRLYEGLREISFAGNSLHGDIANLELLLQEAEAGTLSEELQSLWRTRLEVEQATGERRVEFVYLFGALLEEWTRDTTGDTELRAEQKAAQESLLATALSPAPANQHQEVIDALFDAINRAAPGQAAKFRDSVEKKYNEFTESSAETEPLNALLKRFKQNPYHSASLRQEASVFHLTEFTDIYEKTPATFCELRDAISLTLQEWKSWNWSDEGLTTRALWTHNRWRLYPDADLPTLCLLDSIAHFWNKALQDTVGDAGNVQNRQGRLRKLEEISAPSLVVEYAREQLKQAEMAGALEGKGDSDPWENLLDEEPEEEKHFPSSRSLVITRLEHQQNLGKVTERMGSYDGDYDSAINPLVRLVNAEVRLMQAAFPEQPLFLVKTDLKDYYGTLPHDLLLTILSRLGSTEEEMAFFRRFLTPLLKVDSQGTVRMQRGVPMNFALSHILADLPLRLMERYIRAEARVRIFRQVDDICLLTPFPEDAVRAWKCLQEFCDACGLEVNPPKSGAVCLGGTLPVGLPDGLPRWGMLALNTEGEWTVDQEAFEAHQEQARRRVESAGSLLSAVQVYNTNADFLINALALALDLGASHREAAQKAVRTFHGDFFAPGKGMVDGLSDLLRQRFLSGVDTTGGIPEAWVYWPLTAGGLGLKNPALIAGAYLEQHRKRDTVEPPDERKPGWNTENNEWSIFYDALLETIEPVEPEETMGMKTLVSDFIARGKSISGGDQEGLSPYWRWIVYLYGPQILQRFGTFRFLLTELVPLQLIRDHRLGTPDQRQGEDSD